MTKRENIWGVVKAYEVGRPASLVTIIPKPLCRTLGLRRGHRFLVKTAGTGDAIILELLPEFVESKKEEDERALGRKGSR